MSESGGLGDLTYKDDHRHQTGPGSVTYHVEVSHGRRRSDAKIPESDDGPLNPPYLQHPVDKTHVQVAVEPHGKTMDEMDQEAHLTAYQMGSATSPHDMVTHTRILHVEAARPRSKPRPLQGPEHPFVEHPDDPEQCVECNLPTSNRHHQDVEFQPRLPQPLAAKSLSDLAAAGYNTDGWKRWQQGDCYTYAHALIREKPSLRLGTLDDGDHLFAHDDTHAYDSAGKHPLPYKGVHGTGTPQLDVGHDWYDGPHEPHIPEAVEHIRQHRILEGGFGKKASLTPEDEALLLGHAPKPKETFQEHVNRNWQDIPEDRPESCPTCGDEGEYTGYHNGHHHFECDRCGEGFSKKASRLAHVEPGWEDEQGSMDRYKPRTWHEDLQEAFVHQRVHEDMAKDTDWGGRGEEALDRENGYQHSNMADFRRQYREHGRTAKGVTFPGKHDEQLPLHPDLGVGMEDGGLYKGSPQLPLYRGLQLTHPEDVRDHLGKSHEGDQAIARHFVQQATQGRSDRGHRTTLGIHWSHDREATGDLANHAHTDQWGGHDHAESHPVMLEADHPGHEHVIDFSDASKERSHPDHKVLSDTISPHEYHHAMLPEVPIRPGAPMHLRAIHVQKHDGTYHRIPVGLHTQAGKYDDWRPSARIFGPGQKGEDPRLFDGDHLKPEVRDEILETLGEHWDKRYKDWPLWSKVYFTGSEASHWYGNNDFDVLIGVDYDGFRAATGSSLRDEEIDDAMNADFRQSLNGPVKFGHDTFDRTWYVNHDSYDIRRLKPYAAYDVSNDTWAVRPVVVPEDWGPDKFPPSTWRLAEHYANEIKRISELHPLSVQKQYATQLFNHIHTDRQRAFSERGTGVFDAGNVTEKYLDQRPDHPLALLVEMKNQGKPEEKTAMRTTASDWHAFDTNRHYRRGHQDGAQGVYDQDHDHLSAKVDMGIPLEPHEVDYMAGHAAGTQRAREHAQAQHDIKQVWEQHGQTYGSRAPLADSVDFQGRARGRSGDLEPVDTRQDKERAYAQGVNLGRSHRAQNQYQTAAQLSGHAAAHPAHAQPHFVRGWQDGFSGSGDTRTAKKADGFEPPTVSGVALQAADTGRLLMIQRSNKDEKDPAKGTWEFPGGHHEDGDKTSLDAAIREWEEEVGHPFPEGGTVTHTWRTGPYQGHHVVIPKEEAVDFSNGRRTVNPDDPDCDDHEQSAWWEPEHAKKNPALRQEVKDNWKHIVPGLKQVSAALAEGYSYRHIVHQPKFGNARYGDKVPPPSQEDIYNEGPAKAFGGAHMFEHQIVHKGVPVAKLRYSVHPDEPHVLNIEGLAVHNDHQGKGLAIHLGDKMQEHAENERGVIDHGTYTDQGHYFAQKYMASPNAKKHLHLPYPDKPTGTTGADFMPHMLDPEEMKAGQVGRTASWYGDASVERGGVRHGDWIHLAGAGIGWADDHDEGLLNKSQTGCYHPSNGRVLHGRISRTGSLDGVPIEHHEQEARLAPGVFKEQSQPQAAPSDHVVEGARAYCKTKGMSDPHDIDYAHVRTTADNTRSIGRAFYSLPDHDPDAVPHFESMRKEIHEQFHHMTNVMGIKAHFVDEDPYSTSKEMMHDVHNNRTIKVLKTEKTGGHPFFTNEENDKFRAVHDVFGHAATGRGFDKHGEEAAYTAHSKMFSEHARPAMETETRGQNHFYNLNGRFAKQKVAILGKATGTYQKAKDVGRTALRKVRVYL